MSNENAHYESLMRAILGRHTSREFDASYEVPREHYEMIIEAARHAPSGANAQPWHYIIVTDPELKIRIADYFVAEASRRARLKMKFPSPNYSGMRTAPGLIVVVADFRYVNAFPVLNDGSELDRMYHQNAERILLQSVAASTMSAHLAATSLGYASWWVTAIGQELAQRELKPELGVPEELSILDIMCFGPPAKPPYVRWKRQLQEIMSWSTYDMTNYKTLDEIRAWIATERHKVMYRSQDKIN